MAEAIYAAEAHTALKRDTVRKAQPKDPAGCSWDDQRLVVSPLINLIWTGEIDLYIRLLAAYLKFCYGSPIHLRIDSHDRRGFCCPYQLSYQPRAT